MSAAPKQITQAERTALRSVIRARARALKARIAERKADQAAEVERRINEHYMAQRAVYRMADHAAQKIIRQANDALLKLYGPIVGDHPEWGAFSALTTSNPPDLQRTLMRDRANREVEAQAKAAEARLVYWEADALELVARSGICSDEATAMLDSIGSIESLMPTIAVEPAAETTVDEMVTSEGKALYFAKSHEERILAQHAREWARRNELDDEGDDL